MKNKALKKFFIFFSLGFILASALSIVYLNFNQLFNSFDSRFRDYFFNFRGEIPNSNNIVIIDIDEASLKRVGQWPWSRPKVSELLEKLTQENVALIGFDMVFAEPDKSSPHRVFGQQGIYLENLENYDKTLGETVSKTPTILGYIFEFNDNTYTTKEAPSIPAIFIEKNKQLEENFLFKAKGTILNVPEIQKKAYSSGFFNNIPDETGVIRSVPLIISYDDMIYPSLSLELLRVITQTQQVIINYNQFGVENIQLNNITIPTDKHGRLLVNFRGKSKNFTYYSAFDVLTGKVGKKELEDKVAIIGTSAIGLLDLRATPFESVYPGVEVHANALDNMLVQDFLAKPAWIDLFNILTIFILTILTVLIITYLPFWLNPIIALGILSTTIIGLYQALFNYGYVLNIFFPILSIIIAFIVVTLFDYFYEIKKEKAIKKKFASKVSKEVMENLLKDMDDNKLQAMEKEVTIFFSDIRGFTQISEKMPNAKDLIKYLNEYMEPMSNIITKYEGTIDKYIGDSIMAYWNAPANVENHADKALNAALYQLKNLKILNKKFKQHNQPTLDISIGLNTGLAIVGEMGSQKRSDYTVIGDTINLGSRLESLCKFYDSKINISNYTKEKLTKTYIFRFLDLVKVKGKEKPVEIWEVLDKGIATGDLKEELDTYHKAINLYKKSNFKNALELFEKLDENPNKTNQKIYQIYTHRCKEFIKTPPIDFDGVYEHTTKG
jgi:adenylate cyclase